MKAERNTIAAEQLLRRAIRALVRRFSVSERADVSCCGMTVAQAATLETLGAHGSMRLGDLKQRLGITASTLTRNLSRLEERGLVVRAADEDDARAVRAQLTHEGRQAAVEVERLEVEFAAGVLERIPADRQAQVLESLDQLLSAVRQATEACCPGAFDHLMDDSSTSCSTEAGESTTLPSACCERSESE